MNNTVHLDRKELKRPDSFLLQTTHVFDFVKGNLKAIIVLIIVIGAMVAGILLYRSHREERILLASEARYEAEKVLAQSMEEGVRALEKVYANFKDTPGGYYALMDIGNAYLANGSAQKAVDYFSRAADAVKQPELRASAWYLKADAQERSKDYDGAIASLDRISSGPREKFLRPEALFGLWRNYSAKGNADKAKEYYGMITQEFPETAFAALVKSNQAH